MKTYLWCDSNQSSFEYDFIAVMAESIDEARELAVKEVCIVYEEDLKREVAGKPDPLNDWHNNYHLEERDARCIVINNALPTIIEPGTAKVIEHSNP